MTPSSARDLSASSVDSPICVHLSMNSGSLAFCASVSAAIISPPFSPSEDGLCPSSLSGRYTRRSTFAGSPTGHQTSLRNSLSSTLLLPYFYYIRYKKGLSRRFISLPQPHQNSTSAVLVASGATVPQCYVGRRVLWKVSCQPWSLVYCTQSFAVRTFPYHHSSFTSTST